MHILTESDDMDYETNRSLRSLLNFVFVPILNLLPASASNIIKKSHKSVDHVISNATSHKALEILYMNGQKEHSVHWINKIAHRIWFGLDNSKAVRNRLRLVKRELVKAMKAKLESDNKISILSIASGSARAVIEAISEIYTPGMSINVIFLDKNQEALKYSEQLLIKYPFYNDGNCLFKWIQDTAGKYLRSVPDKCFDVIEMVGLLDYFNDEKAVSVFKDIRRSTNSKGVFITANINYNKEKNFLSKVVGWEMIYRSAEDLGNILLKSGYTESQISLFYEPLRVHVVAVVYLTE